MKTCTKCGEVKPFDAYGKHNGKPDGRTSRCKTCHCAGAKAWAAANKAKVAASNKAYAAAKPEAKAAAAKAWYAANREAAAANNRAHYVQTKDQKATRDARRRALKVSAMPPWADLEKINAIYAEAAALRALGVDVHVDHIVPLQGVNVTGLHVHTNLQILLATDNLSKGNRLACP